MQVSIIGAGIVGMSAALYLQKDGHAVTVFDANEPGSGASYGNAGSISTSMSLPTVTPGMLRRLPKMLVDPYGPRIAEQIAAHLNIPPDRESVEPRDPELFAAVKASAPSTEVASATVSTESVSRRPAAPTGFRLGHVPLPPSR